jgi:hypothetical protein
METSAPPQPLQPLAKRGRKGGSPSALEVIQWGRWREAGGGGGSPIERWVWGGSVGGCVERGSCMPHRVI